MDRKFIRLTTVQRALKMLSELLLKKES